MSLAISPTDHTPATQSAATSKKPAEPRPKPAEAQDSVQISSAAKVALQEAVETQAQTAKEASGGDLQAGKLLAKELAAQIPR